jgi:hypothetical protein
VTVCYFRLDRWVITDSVPSGDLPAVLLGDQVISFSGGAEFLSGLPARRGQFVDDPLGWQPLVHGGACLPLGWPGQRVSGSW